MGSSFGSPDTHGSRDAELLISGVTSSALEVTPEMKENYQTKPQPKSRDGLFVAFTCLGLAGGLFARDVLDTTEAPIQPVEAEQPQPIELTVVVEWPTPTPKPTNTPTPLPIPTPRVDFCDTPVPGQQCRIPEPPEPTPTPEPPCEVQMATPYNAGDKCIWEDKS